jgi:hypothetical protein
MGKVHWKRMLTAIICLTVLTCYAFSNDSATNALKRSLAKQGFTGTLTGKVKISKVGVIAVGDTKYQIFYYEWQESNPPGLAIHASQRIILMKGAGQYIGFYRVEGPPTKVGPQSILFDHPESLGNSISFDKNGPPTRVRLSGELYDLEK